MLPFFTLRDLLDRGVTVRVAEAVAIVQRLMHDDPGASHATGPCGPLALCNVEINSEGQVRCAATAATPSVYEAAVLLQELLSAGTGAVPGALRYTLGRALLEVDAPPFDSRQHFGAALERFEQGPRADAIAALHARASLRGMGAADRRRTTATHAALRRELRDADLRLYAARTASRPIARPEPLRRSAGPIAGCVLAGAALIVAGGAASTLPPRPGTGAARAASEPGGRTHDIALPRQAVATAPLSLVRTPPRRAPRPMKTTLTPAAPTRRRSAPRADRVRTRPAPDADRGVIARIRFEWNNPFR